MRSKSAMLRSKRESPIEDHRPRPNTDTLVRLKIEKLHIKEEMEKLRTRVN